jgi:hypothetical protein
MDWDRRAILLLRPQDIIRARMVYWYVTIIPQTTWRSKLTQYIVAYSLGIYLLNLFLAFISPKFDPSIEQDEGMEDGTSGLPSKENDEFKPFVRRLPEFKFWYSATKAIATGFVCSFFTIFDLPVFWPVLVMYWIILFALTSKCFWIYSSSGMNEADNVNSEKTNTAHDQVQIHSLHGWQEEVWCKIDVESECLRIERQERAAHRGSYVANDHRAVICNNLVEGYGRCKA